MLRNINALEVLSAKSSDLGDFLAGVFSLIHAPVDMGAMGVGAMGMRVEGCTCSEASGRLGLMWDRALEGYIATQDFISNL